MSLPEKEHTNEKMFSGHSSWDVKKWRRSKVGQFRLNEITNTDSIKITRPGHIILQKHSKELRCQRQQFVDFQTCFK